MGCDSQFDRIDPEPPGVLSDIEMLLRRVESLEAKVRELDHRTIGDIRIGSRQPPSRPQHVEQIFSVDDFRG